MDTPNGRPDPFDHGDLRKSYAGKAAASARCLAASTSTLREGEFIAILGFSGAGKTTLISPPSPG